MTTDPTLAKSWPFQEARSLLKHIERKGKKPGDMVTFETGYGPSGAPHIGTFGEVVRTLWVMRAFDTLTSSAYKTRLIMFSDDYDAMRKVPDGMPGWMNDHLGKTLSAVPNPYPNNQHVSFAAANNDKLVEFVDDILTTYNGSVVGCSHTFPGVNFISSSNHYRAGRFNDMLNRVWDNYEAIQEVMLPTLGEDRRATYSPFMPVSDGKVLQLSVTPSLTPYWIEYEFQNQDKIHRLSQSIYSGNVKLQWKVDWAMRWVHFDVDYEMSGKDLIDSVKASSQICRILGGTPPLNLTYELFLDEQGAKISKSKGNGFTVEDWLRIGTIDSLMLFMFQNPKAAKKIYRDLVPQLEDQYLKLRHKDEITLDDPLWHFSTNLPPRLASDISYGLLLNLAIVSQSQTVDELMGYLTANRDLGTDALWTKVLAERVLVYGQDRGLFNRARREPTEQELGAFKDLATRYQLMLGNMTAEHYQYQAYEVGKVHGFENLRDWFKALYECLLGSSDGPRFGVFVQTYGLENTIELLRSYEEPVTNGIDLGA